MTRYHVIHETSYRYESPVALSQQLLHLAPRVLPWQARERHALSVEPAPAESGEREDYFGNPVTQIMLAAPHASLAVRAESTVTVRARPAPAAAGAWESPVAFWTAADNAWGPRLAVDVAGNVTGAWQRSQGQYPNTRYSLQSVRFNASTNLWTPVHDVVPPGNRPPVLWGVAADGSGNTTVAWSEGGGDPVSWTPRAARFSSVAAGG